MLELVLFQKYILYTTSIRGAIYVLNCPRCTRFVLATKAHQGHEVWNISKEHAPIHKTPFC